MNRLLRNIFFVLAMLLAVYAALFANYLHTDGGSAVRAKIVWLALAGSIFFTIAGWRFSPKSKFKIFALVLGLLLVEIFLQAAAWFGVLPVVNIKLKAPFARVYWMGEGHGNDIRNRFGWHYPEFDLKAPKRMVVIGDSFVEALEVNRDHNEAAVLQQLLRAQSPEWSVFGLGNHGASPAFHLDVLDYAQRHFAPQEAVVLLYLGNDINESSSALNYAPPETYIYYDLDASERLTLAPASVACRKQFIHSMESCHGSVWTYLPVIMNSHCMTLQLAHCVLTDFGRSRGIRALTLADPEAAKYGRIGTSLKPFAVKPNAEAQHALAVMFAELALLKKKCDTNHIKLRLVTIPFFPPQFYATQHGAAWSLKIGEYDFLAPDREIAAFAQSQSIPFLSFAEWLDAKKTDVDEVHSLYFTDGSGHFTERGHALCAQAIYEYFYKKPSL